MHTIWLISADGFKDGSELALFSIWAGSSKLFVNILWNVIYVDADFVKRRRKIKSLWPDILDFSTFLLFVLYALGEDKTTFIAIADTILFGERFILPPLYPPWYHTYL